jgi:hypothetical protein
MKNTTILALATFSIALAFSEFIVRADILDGPTKYLSQIRDPHASVWMSYLPPFSLSDSLLNTTVICEPVFSRGLLGYPERSGFVKGIADTVSIVVQFNNRSDTPYVISGTNPEDWFAPQLHRTTMNIVKDAPVVDSTELHYVPRLWLGILGQTSMPDTLYPNSPPVQLVYDVSNIPLGVWVLSLASTNKTPSSINLNYGGCVVDCRYAADERDTINAWLALADRSFNLRNIEGSLYWIDKALEMNPNSVPAWWMLAIYHMNKEDSSGTVVSIDSALSKLTSKSDPLLPDTTSQVLPLEREYMRALPYYLQEFKEGVSREGYW